MLLPFMYQGHRFPEVPNMLLSSSTPSPLCLVNQHNLSCAVVADPADLPFAWPDADNLRYGFSLRNETGLAQPMIYSPVLGLPGSVSEGGPVEARLRLWIQPGDWYAAYRRIADEVFHLTDYRRPVSASLSDAAINLLDLMRDEQASGWDARAKGPWNIESRNTVSQSSPLVYLSYYLLTGDEDFYQRIARPSLEFMLSRPGPHFAAEREISTNYYHHQPMKGPSSQYAAITCASAYAMTQGRTSAFGELCLDGNGAARPTGKHGHVQGFEDALALYELTGSRQWLDQSVAGADKYIAGNLTHLPGHDLGPEPFINVSFIPDWEGLLHLYTATGEKRFLQAATEGARWLLTTLWTQPMIPEANILIHPNGQYDANRHVWWWGDKLYRRGVAEGLPGVETVPAPPPIALPEQQVPAWQVSQVGLGLEQPVTYSRLGPRANIMMNIWAPALLRLAAASGDEAFRTAARNAMIGRFANYPGYYLDGMTNAFQRPDYPVKGPDVTSLYVHHIPPFAEAVIDYLFSDLETRSQGAVSFPWVRQCGYVWFDSRLYGHAPGKVYGQTAWPWLHRTAATVDNINVDRVLAHGDGKFHVMLMNQVHEEQAVQVRFDEKVLGRSLEGAVVKTWQDNVPGPSIPVKDGTVTVRLKPLGLCAFTLDGVKIDVATAPPDKFSLPAQPGIQQAAIADTSLQAIGTVLEVPPFEWRDLYVYVTAALDDCRAATLHYRVGDGPEQTLQHDRFPWEFSVRLPAGTAPVSWRMEVQTADGQWHHTP